VARAVEAAGKPPGGVQVDVRGQVAPLNELFRGLGNGLAAAVVVTGLLLLEYVQSVRLALVAVAAVPAVLAGVALMLLATRTTLNMQSFMGAIMAVGVATANAILFVTFAERVRVGGMPSRDAPVRVVVSVPEADAGLVAPGQGVTITLLARGPAVTGTVTRTSWSLEPGSRTLRTEIDLMNETGQVRPGMYVSAKLTAELPAAWAVPAAAVGKAGDEPVIYLAENGKAVRVEVQLLRGDGQFTQVRRYKKPGAADWTDVSGSESVATPAAALSDGQPLP
jgi:hypothetical protein